MKSKKDYPCELNQSNYSWSPIILHDDLWEIVNVIVSPNNKYYACEFGNEYLPALDSQIMSKGGDNQVEPPINTKICASLWVPSAIYTTIGGGQQNGSVINQYILISNYYNSTIDFDSDIDIDNFEDCYEDFIRCYKEDCRDKPYYDDDDDNHVPTVDAPYFGPGPFLFKTLPNLIKSLFK